MYAETARIAGPLGMIAVALLVAGVVIELKPYPANGWGLDVYESAPTGVAALVSVGVSAGAFAALYKVLPLVGPALPALAAVAGVTFLVSNVIGLKQKKARRLLGYSSIGQVSLLALSLVLLVHYGRAEAIPLVVGGLMYLVITVPLTRLVAVLERRNREAR